LKRRIIFTAILCLAVWLTTLGAAYGATAFTRSLNASVKVLSNANFAFFSDAAATQPVTSISLPDVTPGGTSTFTVYVKNTSSTDELLTGSNTVPSATGTLNLTFDGAAQKTLAANGVSKMVGTLNAPATAAAGTISFTVDVSALPSTPGTTTTTTTGTGNNVSYASAIQPVFNQYCISCHGSSGGVTLTSYSALMSSGAVVAGNAAGSRIYQTLSTGTMRSYGMSPAQVQTLATWINQGAPNN
jgi:mono/diheme cytochrome c family protein